MCGIGAWQIVNNEVDSRQVACSLLRHLSIRGRDASGIAWHQGDGAKPETFVQKQNVSGEQLAQMIDPVIGSTGVAHTRWATQGDPKINGNNHPIDVDGIIGVHNGHVANDDALIKACEKYERKAVVDSEAAFAHIHHGPKKLGLYGRLSAIRGSAALIWLNSYGPSRYLHTARLTSSPLVFAQLKGGSIIVASTVDIMNKVLKDLKVQAEFMHEYAEGEYIRFKDGMLVELTDIPMPKPVFVQRHDYSRPSSFIAQPIAQPTLFDEDPEEIVLEFEEEDEWAYLQDEFPAMYEELRYGTDPKKK